MSSPDEIPLPKKVAIIYTDVKREYFLTEEAYIADKDPDLYANEVKKYVEKLGIECETFACNEDIALSLKNYSPNLAINFVDSVRGQSLLGSSIIGLLEILNIPYTGAGNLGWSIGTNKYLMYKLMESTGIPVPNHQLFTSTTDMIDAKLRYPLFPKLNYEHSSIGIDENSICENERELKAKLKFLMQKFHQPILVDEFISGIEVTAAVLEGMNTKVYAVQRRTGEPNNRDVVTFEKKWQDYLDLSYVKYDAPGLKDYVKKTFEVLKMSDYARIDIRIDQSGRFYFIDPNANPFFGPPKETHSTYSIVLDMYGISFEETLKRIFINTQKEALERTLTHTEK